MSERQGIKKPEVSGISPYLRAGVEKQAADGSEYYADCKEERKDGLGREDGSGVAMSVNLSSSTGCIGPYVQQKQEKYRLTAMPSIAAVERRYLIVGRCIVSLSFDSFK